MNKKIKVLVIPSDRSGVGSFRSITPHLGLEKFYPNEFHIDINEKPDLNDNNFLKSKGGFLILLNSFIEILEIQSKLKFL